MVRSIILTILLTFSLVSSAAGGGWVKDWWNNVYEQKIEKQQYREVLQAEKNKCSTKIKWYEQKLDEQPKSEYYQYKLEHWQDKCSK